MAKHWNIADVWNLAFLRQDEPLKPRDYLFASELGKPHVDVWLKMKAKTPTNLPTSAANRKMEAGKLIESILLFVLKRAGVLKKYQQKVEWTVPGCLRVSGKLDYIAGGRFDAQQTEKFLALANEWIDELGLSKTYIRISDAVTELIRSLAGEELMLWEYIFDAKSVSDFVFRLVERSKKPRNEHLLQVFHYLHGLNWEIGKLAYISREDLRLNEVMVYNNSENYERYVSYVAQMTDYHNSNIQPPLEPLVVYEQESLAFNKNTMGVEWSNYLTLLYGFTSPEQYRNTFVPLVKDMNYVFKRCITAQTMTTSNLAKIKGFRKYFPAWDDLVDQGKYQLARMGGQQEDEPAEV